MQFINYLKSKLPFYVALSFTFILASCGSYQYVGYDSDGIYGSEDVTYRQDTYNETPANYNSGYYKNYFAEKSQQFEHIPEDDVIFTDIDSYQGNYDELQDSTYVSGYSGWGDVSNEITINVRPSYASSFWWYRPYSWNNWYYPYDYFGWDYFGYSPFWYSAYNWHSPYAWYGGFYGYGSWYFSPYWHHRNYYYGNRYYGGYYGSRNIAYNATRRGSLSSYSANYTSNRSTTSLNRRGSSVITRPNNAISRSRINSNTTIKRRGQNDGLRPRTDFNRRTNSSSVRPRVNSTTRPNISSRNFSSSRRSNNSPSINRSSTRSSSSSSRSNNFSSGSSRSSSGSSIRSSGGSPSRSSGGSSRSSGSRRGNQ